MSRRTIMELAGGAAFALAYVLLVELAPMASLAQLLTPDAHPPDAQPPPAVQLDPAPGSDNPGNDAAENDADTDHDRAAPARRTTKARVLGITAAEERLGFHTPTGRGIAVGHVEGNAGSYVPRVSKGQSEIAFVTRSGPSDPNGHTTATARVIYGRRGLAPGVRLVNDFTARGWLTTGYLHTGQPIPPAGPDQDHGLRLFTHSWISPAKQGAANVLRRVDYQIDTRDVIMCVGVNNGKGSAVPALLASSYNAIAVGVLSGNSSGGYTKVEGEGRCKPDIVAPGGMTSFSTPAVTALVARLLQAADRLAENDPGHAWPTPNDDDITGSALIRASGDGEISGDEGEASGGEGGGVPMLLRKTNPDSDARHAEVIKAVLLAGATKPEGWHTAPGKPLDEHLGAGLANFDHSLRALNHGNTPPGRIRHGMGWSFDALTAGQADTFRLDARRSGQPLSIVLTWNRRVLGKRARVHNNKTGQERELWLTAPRLADLSLTLIRVDDAGQTHTVAESDSKIDNVEHVYVPELEPGRYRMVVKRERDEVPDRTWDYAVSWRYGG